MMNSWWWWMWIAFLVFFLLPPVGYGWGYRQWGPPYPRYIQRRRAQAAQQATATAGSTPAFDHQSWGLGGDLLWMILFFWMGAALLSFFWWR